MNQARADISGVIERTFHIRTPNNSGTAFAIEHDERQYMITAKHVIDGTPQGEAVYIFSDLGPIAVSPSKTEVSDGDPDKGAVDVAALKLPRPLSLQSSTPTLGDPEDLFVPQVVAMPTAEHVSMFGASFIVTTRTGTVAAVVKNGQRGPSTGDFLVEMEAYPGFSGSPIVYWDADKRPRVAGVAARISYRYIPQFEFGRVHTGLIGCFHIAHAMELIRAME